MGTIMTPEQMKELAARLRKHAMFISGTAAWTGSAEDIDQAADLIRQMAERGPAAYIEHHKGGDNLIWEPLKTSPQVTPLYAAPPAPQPDDTALLRQALETLEVANSLIDGYYQPVKDVFDAIITLRARLDGAPQPSLSKRLAAAGFTRRDTRIECDECGKKVTPQFLPIHKCEP